MRKIEIDDELYQYIASRTQAIGESASDILRRLLRLPPSATPFALVQNNMPAAEKSTRRNANHAALDESQIDKLIASRAFKAENKMVRRFMRLLSALYRSQPERFALATEAVQGKTRLYFAHNEATLLASGSGVKAKLIANSPFWVVTNNNTLRKAMIIHTLMHEMGFSKALIARVEQSFLPA